MEPNRGLLTKIYSLNTAISLEPNNAHEIPSAYQITSTRHPLTPRKKKKPITTTNRRPSRNPPFIMAKLYQVILAALGATVLSLILAFAFLEIR